MLAEIKARGRNVSGEIRRWLKESLALDPLPAETRELLAAIIRFATK